MMNVKSGTQTWSKSPQAGIQHTENIHTMGAKDEAKFLGDDDIGTALNKIADPNFVDNSKKMRTVGNPEMGKDAFMNLLITQMKNQDPTSPLKSHEMAAQLAQFTTLEKLTNIDQGIEKLRTDAKPDRNFEALALIGKTVSTDSSKFSRLDQKSAHDIRFNLAADAIKTTVTIKDQKGNAVRALSYNNLKAGKNSLSWNGQLEDGTAAPTGDYTIEVESHSSNGAKIFASSKAEGVITGVNFTSHGPQVMVGKDAIDLADVKSITDPGVLGQGPQMPMFASAPQNPGAPQVSSGQDSVLPTASGIAAGHAAIPTPMASTGPVPQQMTAPAQLPPELQNQLANLMKQQNMSPVGPGGEKVAEKHKMEVKPEFKTNSAKRAKLAQGSIEDAKMHGSLMSKLKKEGAGSDS
jgi:flagellar basal-body rod modification protein FlgD